MLFNFRPDLLDWRQVERRDVRERIDLAFHIMDREYGVTRLLDPEGKWWTKPDNLWLNKYLNFLLALHNRRNIQRFKYFGSESVYFPRRTPPSLLLTHDYFQPQMFDILINKTSFCGATGYRIIVCYLYIWSWGGDLEIHTSVLCVHMTAMGLFWMGWVLRLYLRFSATSCQNIFIEDR